MRTTSPGQSALLLLDIIDVLTKQQIEYAIIGAFAASFYGMVRASIDADAVISIHTGQNASLCAELRSYGLTVEERSPDMGDPIAGVINIQDKFHNRVDLLLGIRGMPKDIFERVQEARFKDTKIQIVGREDFIAMKMFAGSPKDLQDAAGVMAVSGSKINLDLLRKLTGGYGVDCVQRLEIILKKN